MPKIIVDGKEIECREGVAVLQAALEAGWNVPHYCYHPGLTVVASCRLCLMEQKMPHPKTKEMVWAPKLVPSCQTPVKEGMEVRFASDMVVQNQKHVMEYYLLNHPLDCPVCDKAGECSLQDYSEEFGNATSRMVEDKTKNPKKDIGSHTLLYSDRCVVCSRCVRFTQEIAGTGELGIVSRGNRAEIDVFPGVPLENELQGNVVDLCPVGALLDKEFLFRQRVWTMKSVRSISPADSRGQNIWIDFNEHGVHRIRPRFNEKVNEWWISDEARFGWKYIASGERLNTPQVRRNGTLEATRWESLAGELQQGFAAANGAIAAMLSPMMSCEEAWLLAKFVRGIGPQATLVCGPAPTQGADRKFPKGFIIAAEKCPNRAGIERLIKELGGPALKFDDFVREAGAGKFKAAYVVGGYPEVWLNAEQAAALGKIGFLVVHDLFASALSGFASVQIPAASWAEREGCWMNRDGLLQECERAIPPLDGVKGDGQFFQELAGEGGLYRGRKVRERMATSMPEFATLFVPRELPEHAH